MTKELPIELQKILYNDLRTPYTPIDPKNATPRELALDQEVREAHIATQPVVEDYQKHGFEIINLSEICHLRQYFDNQQSFELVLKWLPRVKNTIAKDVIMDIMYTNIHTAENLDRVVPLIVHEWMNVQPKKNLLRQVIANIFMKFPSEKYYDLVLSLARNDAGLDMDESDMWFDRGLLIDALTKLKTHPHVFEDIMFLYASNKRFENSAIEGFGNLRDPRALPFLQPFLTHKDSWKRNLAKKAVSKIENAQKKLKKP